MANQIQLVALDVDGTLLNRDFVIPPATTEAIHAARARGVRFAIVTGRMYQAAAPIARELGLEGTLLVTYNGALIKEFPSGRTIYHEPLPLDVSKAIAAFCEARGYHVQGYQGDELYVPQVDERARQYQAIAGVEAHPVGSVFLWLSEPPTKLLIIDEPARIPVIQQEIAELVGAGANLAQSYPSFLEIFSPKASKGAALAALAAEMGLSADQVMAVGDGMNDLSMLTWAGTSFAMAHAPEPVRRATTHVTKAGAGDGVAEALTRMGLV
jgi:Cof subfamily protein (haloacid dehalogenase superfamily)